MPPIRVLVADDHAVTRAPLREKLDRLPDVEVVGEAADGQEAVYLAQTLRPDVVLMDLSMPRLNGLQAGQAILRTVPGARLVVLTGYADEIDGRGLAPLGISAYLTKSATFDELVATIRAVHAGQDRVPTDVRRRLEEADRQPVDEPTARELEVLRLTAEGLHNREIAERLSVRERTVEFHVANLRAKLGAHSRVELVRLARRRGWMI